MALIDLDKITITRNIFGIRCTVCGGNLIVSDKKSLASRIAGIVSLGTLKPNDYECEICKKRYLLL
ncbi:hypothetical protein [Dyadobacter aurulentus]|uniref:hypothetical protein n=1 Tax=Dyadobacter sp. UC 10 TaxID=2605428 RepID=UPI0011F1A8BE|nr:hypothetical protein [Dyadobacter sp. UC 10]KAA0993475.1 hypothetical protein FXO21_26505 [Dyadobacter sp. UC 10]